MRTITLIANQPCKPNQTVAKYEIGNDDLDELSHRHSNTKMYTHKCTAWNIVIEIAQIAILMTNSQMCESQFRLFRY